MRALPGGKRAAGPSGVLTRMARLLTLARWGTDGALTNHGAAGY